LSYIGNTPAEKYQTLQKQSFTTSATTGYTLSYSVSSPQDIALYINNVRQNPNSSYTVSGTTLTLSSATTGTDVMYAVFLGKSVGTIAPALGSVTRNMLANPWQSVQTTAFTAVAGYAYPCNTTSAAFTVTLPSSASVGDTIQIVDYAGTFATNNITLTSSLNIEGSSNKLLTTNREGVTITYADATQGWVATSGVNSGDQALDPTVYSADFLVIAGGGSGSGSAFSGGGGAGGYRNSYSSETSGGGGGSETNLTFNGEVVYTITVGAGGAGGASDSLGNDGGVSSISGSNITDITTVGGGTGVNGGLVGLDGGSGGGGTRVAFTTTLGGSGTSNQGFDGGRGTYTSGAGAGGGGGGGAGGVGQQGSTVDSNTSGGNGGIGLASAITGSSVSRGGGGGGSTYDNTAGVGTSGGGNGAKNSTSTQATAGTANTGGGGGGGAHISNTPTGASGGSGVVILRMPTASYSGTTTGSPTVSTSGTDTILIYNASGSYTG